VLTDPRRDVACWCGRQPVWPMGTCDALVLDSGGVAPRNVRTCAIVVARSRPILVCALPKDGIRSLQAIAWWGWLAQRWLGVAPEFDSVAERVARGGGASWQV